uniref:MIF4G-like type 2 domain-containing protein n=1 Tax=Brassica oleracea TaxID=3712 RepID=A0A3P6E0Z5_BRAOL|nr:unnamed protein product [Brassica oleracea]
MKRKEIHHGRHKLTFTLYASCQVSHGEEQNSLRISWRIYGIEHSLWLPMDGNLIVISTWPPGLFTFFFSGEWFTIFFKYLMAETLFSQALPGAFPAVVAGAVRALFEKISDLDMDSRTRLILCVEFTYIMMLMNHVVIDEPCLTDPTSSSSGRGKSGLMCWTFPNGPLSVYLFRRFFKGKYACLTGIKLSREHNASGLEELLPAKVGRAYMYSLEEGKEKTEEHELSAELNRKVKEKQYARDMMSWIEETIYPVHGFEVTLTVVAQTLLDIGSKIFTHLVTVLERYGQVFAKLCPDNDKQVMLLSQVSTYWMMGYRLVSNQAIVRWVFSPENVDQFHVSDQPWEILGNALNKTYNRISDLRKEISSIKKNVLVAEKASANARVELEAAESKLLLVEGEPVLGDDPLKMKRLRTTVEKTGEAEFYCSRCFRVSLQSSRSGSQNQQKQDHCRI